MTADRADVRVDLVVESANPERLGEFWAALLERPVRQGAGACTVAVTPSAVLEFRTAAAPGGETSRHHLDVASTSSAHQASLVARAQELGACETDIGQGRVPWQVMTDPDGNAFCILEPRSEYRDSGPLAALVTHVRDPQVTARFWSALLATPVAHRHPDYVSLRPGETGPALEFVRHPDPPRNPGRTHVRVLRSDRPAHPVDDRGEVRHCRVCGPSCVVVSDPERNDVCLAPLR
ncbi:VOC family protein [Mycolicibacterium sp. 018/SC-01/001]|uniref:VOC family protein n=1 Tax=Mycolicibacterium sp. 018/SC-01/001 TaxID=2592069 RepID=UPI00117E665D|nr:VOC family protein [Mycolicibacterium sp. 018/SC-01/001]TRW80314.1 VOC family protein [Mycolicibacterium sp. 018/SC-01/001]